MTEAKNPLVKLRKAQGMTCYNGYIGEMHRWTTKEQFVEDCMGHEEFRFRGVPSHRKARIRRLAREAWDWWFQVEA